MSLRSSRSLLSANSQATLASSSECPTWIASLRPGWARLPVQNAAVNPTKRKMTKGRDIPDTPLRGRITLPTAACHFREVAAHCSEVAASPALLANDGEQVGKHHIVRRRQRAEPVGFSLFGKSVGRSPRGYGEEVERHREGCARVASVVRTPRPAPPALVSSRPRRTRAAGVCSASESHEVKPWRCPRRRSRRFCRRDTTADTGQTIHMIRDFWRAQWS